MRMRSDVVVVLAAICRNPTVMVAAPAAPRYSAVVGSSCHGCRPHFRVLPTGLQAIFTSLHDQLPFPRTRTPSGLRHRLSFAGHGRLPAVVARHSPLPITVPATSSLMLSSCRP